MQEIVFGSTNPAKLERVINIVKPMGFQVLGLNKFGNLPDIEEDGETVLENAKKKAEHYAKLIMKTVLAMDTSLYLDGDIAKEDQPALYLRRVKSAHHRLTDTEMIAHYSKLFAKYGEKVTGHWETAWVLANSNGVIGEIVVKSPPRYYVSKPSNKITPGFPIDSLQIDPENGKYFSEMSPKEKDTVWGKVVNNALKELLGKL